MPELTFSSISCCLNSFIVLTMKGVLDKLKSVINEDGSLKCVSRVFIKSNYSVNLICSLRFYLCASNFVLCGRNCFFFIGDCIECRLQFFLLSVKVFKSLASKIVLDKMLPWAGTGQSKEWFCTFLACNRIHIFDKSLRFF